MIRRGERRSLRWFFRAAQVRLRFLAALAVAFLIVARWDLIRTYYDRWTAPKPQDSQMGAVSADTEYFCPMDPGVLSGWPGKCPICVMALVRRTKGDMGPLPSGVISRVQLSPERILIAGIRAEPVRYRPLATEIRTAGRVASDGKSTLVRGDIGTLDAASIKPGSPAEVSPDPADGTPAVAGKVRSVETQSDGTVRLAVEVAAPPVSLAQARFATVLMRSVVSDREPFRSMPRGLPTLSAGDPRSIEICSDHPELIRLKPGVCPKDQKPLESLALATNQKVNWWCPMHPKVVADRAGSKCDECGGMILVPRVVTYCPLGEVLAVPESAVIDTGTKTMVYLERMPGMFDGVEVRLGQRSGSYYPIVSGLEAGQAVAVSGAFLVDAETRLNPSLAAGYFGAKRGPAEPPRPEPKSAGPDLSGLSSADRERAIAQKNCPVTGEALGSMGTPTQLSVKGRQVFLCCEGCEAAMTSDPDRYLARLKSNDPAHPHD